VLSGNPVGTCGGPSREKPLGIETVRGRRRPDRDRGAEISQHRSCQPLDFSIRELAASPTEDALLQHRQAPRQSHNLALATSGVGPESRHKIP